MNDTTAHFLATEVGYDVRDGALEARLSTEDPNDCHLAFQRRAPGEPGDESPAGEARRIHVEFPDTGHGGYDLVQHCRLSRNRLVLSLDRPLNGRTEVIADIEVPDAAFERFLAGMRKVFSDKHHLLHLADELL